jgi:hypothetical protein
MHDKLDVIWEKEPTMKIENKKDVWSGGGVFHPDKNSSSLTSKDPNLKSFIARMDVRRVPKFEESKKKEDENCDNCDYQWVYDRLRMRKIERAHINTKQVASYDRIIKYIENRKVEFKHVEKAYEHYLTMDERERAFLDALRPILQNGYFLAPHDFNDIIQIVREIDDADEPPSLMKASMGGGSIFGGSRADTEKRQA